MRGPEPVHARQHDADDADNSNNNNKRNTYKDERAPSRIASVPADPPHLLSDDDYDEPGNRA